MSPTILGNALCAGCVHQFIVWTRVTEGSLQSLFIQCSLLWIRAGVVGPEAADERIRSWKYGKTGDRL